MVDILSHALWNTAIFKVVNNLLKKKFSLLKAAFWGVFPDLFAFAIIFIWMNYNRLIGNSIQFSPTEPFPESGTYLLNLTSNLYNLSHSAIIFLITFLIIALIFRKPVYTMLGWLVHILIDIPTHSVEFYPTPFLWPFSSFKFNGIPWGTPWFFYTNWILLTVILLILFRKKVFKFLYN
jgi:hypothetical protein